MDSGIDLTQILLQNGISSLLVIVIFLILYFQSKRKAETLIIKDEDRKDDTDEVAKDLSKTNNQQDVDLGRIDERLKAIETNHLVHLQSKLETLEMSNNTDHKNIEVSIAKLDGKVDILLKQ